MDSCYLIVLTATNYSICGRDVYDVDLSNNNTVRHIEFERNNQIETTKLDDTHQLSQ